MSAENLAAERDRWRRQKARQREQIRVGSKTETVRISDSAAWSGVLEAAGVGSTEAFIEDQCERFRLQRAERSRVGLLAREGDFLPASRLIRASDLRRPSEAILREAQELGWGLLEDDDGS